jgi:two-component system, sensor histidine kinase PhcS
MTTSTTPTTGATAERDPIAVRPLADAYREFDTTLRVRQAKVCCIFALVLVPACIGLDYVVYPELLWPLFQIRLWQDIAVLPFFVMVFLPIGRRHIRLIGNVPALFPAVSICGMIYLSEGVFSGYYAGLNIVMVAVILLIPYTLREGMVVCGIMAMCYVITCVAHKVAPPPCALGVTSGLSQTRQLFSNLYFLGLTDVMALSACHYSALRRFKEFSLRYELDANNRELESTVRKLQETEVQLVQSEKMNALGKLSAGLLHEINNPLNFTFMALQVAQQEAGENETLRETLTDIDQGMGRIRSVISDLRAFAYPSKASEEQEFNLDEALTTALRLTAHELGDIPVERGGLPAGVRVRGGKTQVVHVFMNLLVNSAHALKSEPLPGRAAKIEVSGAVRGGRLDVRVRDNGIGIPPENLPRLAEPFFTTKQPGEGTGLGLSISHTIIKNHGGTLRAASELGQWTEISFDFPLADSVRSQAA